MRERKGQASKPFLADACETEAGDWGGRPPEPINDRSAG